jgi:hypothetical protein
VTSAAWPAGYQIVVDSVLDDRWADWFAGLHIENDGDQTTLSGTLQDPSALHGVLDQIHHLGLSIITVSRQPRHDARGETR